jgi:hypothetical protein
VTLLPTIARLQVALATVLLTTATWADNSTRDQALEAMATATGFFRAEVATQGGYLWKYRHDMAMREGEGVASESVIWVQPPGTPAVGLALLDAWAATGDSLYLQGAVEAARALVWGQLASGGWDYRIDFDPVGSQRWHYRRDIEAGDTETGDRRNQTTFDDNTSQSALRLLMRVDVALGFTDAKIGNAVRYALDAFVRSQYPNGAWPQRYVDYPVPEQYPVQRASYPESWPREYPRADYRDYYTFNDNAIVDVIDVMLEASRIYGDTRFGEAAMAGGDFMLLAQMPEPQPTWAQQYNGQMQPAWARRFEPASVTGGESFGVMGALLGLYIETGADRFLEPLEPALQWARRSLLPDGRLARFYELHTNRPLYFVRDTYELTYSDADMPTHYSFKVSGAARIESIETTLRRIREEGRQVLLGERRQRFRGPLSAAHETQVRDIIASLDERGRWVEDGAMRAAERGQPAIPSRVISCRTFNRNLRALSRYVALQRMAPEDSH